MEKSLRTGTSAWLLPQVITTHWALVEAHSPKKPQSLALWRSSPTILTGNVMRLSASRTYPMISFHGVSTGHVGANRASRPGGP
jgi:hypothetical protein